MSQENVDRFLEAVQLWNRQDLPGVLRILDPEIRFEHRLAALEGSYVGVDGVRGFFADLAEHFDTWEIDCRDVRDLGDRVLALGINHATGKESGVETELPFTVVASFRQGRITHFIDFGNKDQALEAAGLRE
jgi:ketosteroid isomerase-like protein